MPRLSNRRQEDARERQQDAAIRDRRIGLCNRGRVSIEKSTAFDAIQRFKKRPQAAAFEPLHHGLGAPVQKVIISGSPQIDLRAEWPQDETQALIALARR